MPQQAACHHQEFDCGNGGAVARRMRRGRQWREHTRWECPADRYAFANPGGNADAIPYAFTNTNGCGYR
ncbi:hypothetical protein NZL82_19290 [Sphingomonas sanguinis]|uniref:hypothetical protein n=1 Tax=Sphingomonas sp. LC-1 TaxID=3110957 RepID=UPI0021BA4673|nr:hypothetical protein [Sphingomonas sp. LC-1]MCT8004013.1 hypothetical protein [Sphingomonas sp. LC-1]